jgi:hypothetical protein
LGAFTAIRLSPGFPTFVARLTGFNYECYPQIVDDLAEYIEKHQYDSRMLYNSITQVKIDVAKAACASSIELSRLLSNK